LKDETGERRFLLGKVRWRKSVTGPLAMALTYCRAITASSKTARLGKVRLSSQDLKDGGKEWRQGWAAWQE